MELTQDLLATITNDPDTIDLLCRSTHVCGSKVFHSSIHRAVLPARFPYSRSAPTDHLHPDPPGRCLSYIHPRDDVPVHPGQLLVDPVGPATQRSLYRLIPLHDKRVVYSYCY